MWLERKYTGLLSNRLERFSMKGNVASFRCPICGDSKTNKYKTRGVIVMKSTGTFFHCHNCNSPIHKFGDFLKFVDPVLFNEYLKEILNEKYSMERSLESGKDEIFEAKPEFQRVDDKLASLKKVSQLTHDHPVRMYVDKRQIPTSEHHRIYYAPKFKTWTNSIIPGKFESLDHDEPRLILPFLDANGVFYGFQGRSFRKKATLRYITIMVDEDRPKVFGLDKVNLKKTVRVVEGPIDSFFLKNCIATAGGKLQSELAKMEMDPASTVVIYDNEPRNHDVVHNIENAIDQGYPVVIWPDHIDEKDLNDYVLAGGDAESLVQAHTYKGLTAKLKLASWRKS